MCKAKVIALASLKGLSVCAYACVRAGVSCITRMVQYVGPQTYLAEAELH